MLLTALPPQPTEMVSMNKIEINVNVGRQKGKEEPSLFLWMGFDHTSREFADKYEKVLNEMKKRGKVESKVAHYEGDEQGLKRVLGYFPDVATMRSAVVKTLGDGSSLLLRENGETEDLTPSDIIKMAEKVMKDGMERG